MPFIDMKIRRSPIQTTNILDLALKALEYQWSMEHWGSGRERWTPDHTQHMANVIDHIANLITAFEPYKSKELLEIIKIEEKEIR